MHSDASAWKFRRAVGGCGSRVLRAAGRHCLLALSRLRRRSDCAPTDRPGGTVRPALRHSTTIELELCRSQNWNSTRRRRRRRRLERRLNLVARRRLMHAHERARRRPYKDLAQPRVAPLSGMERQLARSMRRHSATRFVHHFYGAYSIPESGFGLDSAKPSIHCANANPDSRIQRIQF